MWEIQVGTQHHQISVSLLVLRVRFRRHHRSIIHANVLRFRFPAVLPRLFPSSQYCQYCMLHHSADKFLGLISSKPKVLVPRGFWIHAVPKVNGFPRKCYLCLQLPGNRKRMGGNTAPMVGYRSGTAALQRLPTTAALGDPQRDTLRLAKAFYNCLGQAQQAYGRQWGTLDLPL